MNDLYPLPPSGDQFIPQPPPEAPVPTHEIIREGGIKHEYSIRGLGTLFFFLGSLSGVAGMVVLGVSVYYSTKVGAVPTSGGMTSLFAVGLAFFLTTMYFILGYGLRGVRPWVRVPTAILGFLMLLRIPIGTLIGIYALSVTLGKKGSHIFSHEYQEAMRMTPHMKYKPKASMVSIVILAILLIAIVGLLISFIVQGI